MREEIADFIEKLNELIIEVDGKSGIQEEELLALVRSNPDTAAAAVFVLLQAEHLQRGARQLAFAVAAAYERITGDDSLTLRAQRTIAESGGRLPTIKKDVERKGQQPPEEKGIALLQVNESDLQRCDVYSFVRIFRVDQAELSVTPGMRGRFGLAFPVDADPRPAWQIPEVRAFIRALFEALPHFPYFLNLRPELGSFMLFFGCLAEPEAFQPTESDYQPPGEWQRISEMLEEDRALRRRQGLAVPSYEQSWVFLNVLHPSVVEAVAVSIAAVADLCGRLGQRPRDFLEQLLTPYAPEIRESILGSIAGLGEDV